MRDGPQVLGCDAQELLQLDEDRRRRGAIDGVCCEQLSGVAELDRHRDQVLLCAVVQVTLDAAALLIGHGNEPGARCL